MNVTPNDGTDDGVTEEADIDAVGRETCLDYYNSGFVTDGVYILEASNGTSFDAYCDMSNGGWTLVVAAQGSDTSFSISQSIW